MNSENGKTSKPHVLILKRELVKKLLLYQILTFIKGGKRKKKLIQ